MKGSLNHEYHREACKRAGHVVMYAAGATVALTGATVSGVGKLITKDDNFGEGLKSFTTDAGKTIANTAGVVGKGCEKVVDTTFALVGETGAQIVGGTAMVLGADEQGVKTAKNVGRIAAGAGIGILTGDILQAGLIGMAGAGAASTGTFIGALSGAAHSNAVMAALGGGALSAGGGGMAAGQALLTAIDVGTAVDGAVAGTVESQKLEEQ